VTACATPSARVDLPVQQVSVGNTALEVWVADEPGERSRGLRDVTTLPDGIGGMLFVFSPPSTPTFVMEDTLIPLDLWFFDEAGEMIGWVEMTPCPSDPCARYPAPGQVGWALETPSGTFEFEVGEMLTTSDSG
jgi:uncharacterized membrane protein (UPF0127 family)